MSDRPASSIPTDPLMQRLRQLADRCVLCGMCLPHCPTYVKTQNEGESPRGRISLISGLASGRLPPSPGLAAHLDNCLNCLACQRVCPSGVEYGTLIDGAREALATHSPRMRPRSLLQRILLNTVTRPALMRAGAGAVKLAGALRLARRPGLGAFSRMVGYLPARVKPLARRSGRPSRAAARGRVGLFTGCITRAVDQTTLEASRAVLERLGYDVTTPAGQTCCGALHAHSGEGHQAARLAGQNLAAFDDPALEAVVFTASGCGAHLVGYPSLAQLPTGHKSRAEAFAARTREICEFVNSVAWPQDLEVRPLRKRVAVLDPCSLTHALRQAPQPYALLARIPELEVVALPGNGRCCGAAGSYMLDHPQMADALREDKLDALAALQPDLLATANIGCALHLAAGLRARGMDIEVVHPVVLLARQMTA